MVRRDGSDLSDFGGGGMQSNGIRITSALIGCVALGISALVSSAFAQQPTSTSVAATPTPRTADGHPDLNGYWGAGGPGFPAGPQTTDGKSTSSVMRVRNGDISNLTNDGVIARRSTNNIPLYKPEYWERVLDLDYHGNLQDPFNSCMPPGVPRMGAPRRIVLLPSEVFFFHAITFQRNDYRAVPIGERLQPVDPDGTWMGDPIARWDGDTLVVVTEAFNDQSWIAPQGYIHGYEMKVTEKFRRDGNKLYYDVTVEDPEYLQKPWVKDTVILNKIMDPKYRMEESPPCSDRDNKNLVGKQREM
jgi:hypothetical protein